MPPTIAQPWFEFTRLVRQRGWTIRTFAAITTIVVVMGTWLQSPIYQATATVLIDMETPNVLSVSTTRDESIIGQMNYMTYADYYRTQIEVMRSRSIAEKVFRNLKLGEDPGFAGSKDPVGMLLKQVRIEPVKQTRLARVHVEDHRPKQAALVANEFAMVYALENLNKTSASESMILMKNEYLKLRTKEAELSKRYKAKHPAMIRIRKELEQLVQSIEQGTQGQAGEANLSASLRPNNIRVQDLAETPLKPVRPKRLLSFILGLFFGLLGGVAMAVMQEFLDSSLNSPEDVERDGKVVLLGMIPQMERMGGPAGNEFQSHTDFSHVEKFSPVAEAYRSIRTTLMYASAADKNGQAILFTRPGPEEGKTTTVSNLGAALAQNEVKVLVVDADLRRGRMADVFQIKRSPGLSEYLTGQATLEQVIQQTEIPNLSVVATGVYPPFPAELVGSVKMQEFLQQACAKFDRVLLDSPPVIAVTDAVIVAAKVGTVIAVARSGKTPRQALYRLDKICRDVKAKVLGVILNGVPVWSTPSYYTYSSYGYYSRKKELNDSSKLKKAQ